MVMSVWRLITIILHRYDLEEDKYVISMKDVEPELTGCGLGDFIGQSYSVELVQLEYQLLWVGWSCSSVG